MESVNLDMLSVVPFLPPYLYSFKVLFIWVIYSFTCYAVQCTLDDCQSIHDFLKKTYVIRLRYNITRFHQILKQIG